MAALLSFFSAALLPKSQADLLPPTFTHTTIMAENWHWTTPTTTTIHKHAPRYECGAQVRSPPNTDPANSSLTQLNFYAITKTKKNFAMSQKEQASAAFNFPHCLGFTACPVFTWISHGYPHNLIFLRETSRFLYKSRSHSPLNNGSNNSSFRYKNVWCVSFGHS